MRSSSSSERPKRMAFFRAACGEMATTPKKGVEEVDEVKEGEEKTVSLANESLWVAFPCFLVSLPPCFALPRPDAPFIGNDSTSVGPFFPRYARFQRAISASLTKHTHSDSFGRESFRRTRARNASRERMETGTRCWQLRSMARVIRRTRVVRFPVARLFWTAESLRIRRTP